MILISSYINSIYYSEKIKKYGHAGSKHGQNTFYIRVVGIVRCNEYLFNCLSFMLYITTFIFISTTELFFYC